LNAFCAGSKNQEEYVQNELTMNRIFIKNKTSQNAPKKVSFGWL